MNMHEQPIGQLACALPGAAQGQRLRLQEEHQALRHPGGPQQGPKSVAAALGSPRSCWRPVHM